MSKILAVGLMLFLFTGGTLCFAQANYKWTVSTELSMLPNNYPGPATFTIFTNSLLTQNTQKVVKFDGKVQTPRSTFPLCGAQKKNKVVMLINTVGCKSKGHQMILRGEFINDDTIEGTVVNTQLKEGTPHLASIACGGCGFFTMTRQQEAENKK